MVHRSPSARADVVTLHTWRVVGRDEPKRAVTCGFIGVDPPFCN